MAKFHVQFIIDGSRLGDMFEVLHPLRIEDYQQKMVAGTPTKVRAGDKTAAEIVLGQASWTPQPASAFAPHLVAAGFSKGTVYTTLKGLVECKQLRAKKVGGKLHYLAPAAQGAK